MSGRILNERRWLIVLALLNVAVYVAAVVTRQGGPITVTGSFVNGVTHYQVILLGLVAGLTLRRATVGLLVVLILTALAMAGVWFGRPNQARPVALSVACAAISQQSVAWGLRILFGWRLFNSPPVSSDSRRQFQVLDLLEWMLLIAMATATLMYQAPNSGITVGTLAHFVISQAAFSVLSIPLLVAIARRHAPHPIVIGMIVVLSIPIAIGALYADFKLQHIRMISFNALAWRAAIPSTLGGLVCVAANSYALRCILFGPLPEASALKYTHEPGKPRRRPYSSDAVNERG